MTDGYVGNNAVNPIGLTLITGAPRSGTSVLHSLACSDLSVNPYVGEASHLRLLVQAYRQSVDLFEPHTRFYFKGFDDHRDFHRDLIATTLRAYARVLGNPDRLVLKDPLIMHQLPYLAAIVPDVRIVIILRNPCDVVASRMRVQQKAGDAYDMDRVIAEHNQMMRNLLADWAIIKPHVVTYPMMAADNLDPLKKVLDLPGIDVDRLWERDLKRFDNDMQSKWKTPLYGSRLRLETSTREFLSDVDRAKVFEKCMPFCHKVLKAARLGADKSPYWNTP